MRRRLMLLAALGVVACNLNVGPTSSTPPNDPSDPATETFAASLNINLATFTKTSLGDYYKILRAGSGPQLTSSQVVVFSYITYLKTGVVVDEAGNLQQDLSQVIRGLQDGMIGMQTGEERAIVIPSALAFGQFGKAPIPPNATLVYDVVLDIIP